MPGNFKREDLRVVKTRKALFAALLALLESRRTFAKLTVNDICVEALVSRTAFYAHFKDKYDLLEQWLNGLQKRFIEAFRTYTREELESRITAIFQAHFRIVENLLKDADREQLDILLRTLSPDKNSLIHTNTGDFDVNTHVAAELPWLSHFLAGGIFNVVYAQVREQRDSSAESIRTAVACIYQLAQAVLHCGEKIGGSSND
jgi:AcrR family transcriptional regulator